MFGSLFSDRYSTKRDNYYAQYEATRLHFPNLPYYRRPQEPLKSKSPKRFYAKWRHADYDYDDWIAGNFVSIVVRRSLEQWSGNQLMDLAPSEGIDFCSWRSWPRDVGDGSLRRSQRLTEKPSLKLKHIGSNLGQQDTKVAIKWQQRLPTLESEGIKNESTAGQELNSTFIDGWRRDSMPQCNMCGSHFGKTSDLQRHSLDECRRLLLATLDNSADQLSTNVKS